MSVSIQKANINDMDYLLGELQEFVVKIINEYIFLIAEKDERQIGFVASMLLPHIYNSKKIIASKLF